MVAWKWRAPLLENANEASLQKIGLDEILRNERVAEAVIQHVDVGFPMLAHSYAESSLRMISAPALKAFSLPRAT